MYNQACIKSSNKLLFCREIVFRRKSKGWLVISVLTANWIVLQSDYQKYLLERLISGNTIGEIIPFVKTEHQLLEFKSLLATIYARDFARIDTVPMPTQLEGNKMLNCYVTNACNLRCKHCFMHSGTIMENELPIEEWKRIMHSFKSCGGVSVTFTGGEPMMKRGFPDLVKYTRNLGLNVTILSNGTLWDDESISDIAPYISEIQISIDGVDEQSNSKVRGSGHFDKVKNTIIAFANRGVKTSVATTFIFENLSGDTASQYKSMVSEIKSKCTYPIFFKLSKRILFGRNINYSEEQNQEYYQRIVEIENGVDSAAKYQNFMEGHTPNLVAANCGFGGLSISSNGEVFYCNRISEVESYGSVRGKDLAGFIEIGCELHRKTAVDVISPCKDCYLRYICSGGCRIDDCNFRGKLHSHKGPLLQVKCSDSFRENLEIKMMESFEYTYKF